MGKKVEKYFYFNGGGEVVFGLTGDNGVDLEF